MPVGRMFIPIAMLGALGAVPGPGVAQNGSDRLIVRGLHFEGNRSIDDFTLSVSIATSLSNAFARHWWLRWAGLGERRYFDEQEFRRDVFRVLALYRVSGFLDARVDTVVNRSDEAVSVTFRITEGEPVRVRSMQVEGMEGIMPSGRLLRELPLQVGDPFDRLRLLASVDTLHVILGNRGYPYPLVLRNFEMDAAARVGDISFEVDPGPRAEVGEVEVDAAGDVDESLVLRTMRVRSGDRFRQDALYESQQDLYRLGVFDFVNVQLADTAAPAVEDSVVDVRVQVSPGRLRRIRMGGGYGTGDCFRTLTSWTVRNFLGGARTLDMSLGLSKIGTGEPFGGGFENNLCSRLGRDEPERLKLNYNVTVGVAFPYVLSPRTSATVSVSAERFSEFQAFVRNAIGFNVALTRELTRRVPVTLSYALSYGNTLADDAIFCSILNVCRTEDAQTFKQDRFKSTAGILLLWDESNSPINPSRGSVLSVEGRVASPLIGSDAEIEFAKGVAEFASYHPVGRRGVVAWRVRWGSARSPNLSFDRQEVRFIPTEERFYGGGPNSVRGFRQNELGPLVHVIESDVLTELDTTVVDTLVSPTGGNQLVFGNLEYRFPLPFSPRIGAVLFVDAGQVFARGEPTDAGRGIRITPGAGIRFFTPVGPVRFDVAYNPHGPERGPLFIRNCVTTDVDRTCDDEPTLVSPSFSMPTGSGIFRNFRFNFSIGQAF